jgi:hypothetical protein
VLYMGFAIIFFQLILALLVAPFSCMGGLSLYALYGVIAMIALAILPFAFNRRGRRPLFSIAIALSLFILEIASWLLGFFGANIRLLCQLI